ncbi:response regulator transcription factor [Synergistaceae bacterium OttesenSCG-928-D05]|nr:response regulator transcription factor [Synergistaceae bacterium OttesenSCG-928-D05]
MSEKQPRILIVDDDMELRELLVELLSEYGYLSEAVKDGAGMFDALKVEIADLILLDIMMPGEDGLTLCRRLRTPGSAYCEIPIIFLTALKDTADKVVGLELGGDDYLCKPFQARELIARIRALLRRTQQTAKAALEELPHGNGNWANDAAGQNACLLFGSWKLNILARHLVDEKGVVVPLSAAEFRLLVLFLEHPQQVVTRDKIMDYLAERSLNIYDRSIDAQVSRLRGKLRDKGPNPSIIRTMRGDGYMLAVPVERGSL